MLVRFWKSCEIVNESYFHVRHKNKQNHNKHLCYFSCWIYTLAYQTNYMHNVEKLFLISSFYLVFCSLETHTDQTRLIQSRLYHNFFTVWKVMTRKPSKYSNCEKLVSINYFHSMWQCDNLKIMFFIKVYRYAEVLFDWHVLVFFEASLK